MKITFSNLGAIKKTELDLRPLTLIIGPNNSNKTYIAYSIYGIWKTIRNKEDYLYGEYAPIQNSFASLFNDKNLSLNVNKSMFNAYSKFFELGIEYFKKDLNVYFQDSSQELFKATNFELTISESDLHKAIERYVNKSNYIYEKIKEVKLENKTLSFVFNSQNISKSILAYAVSLELKLDQFQRPFLLPAERNAFIITYKMLANRRYKFLRQTQRELFNKRHEERQIELLKEQGDIRYPQPIEDFLDFLADVELETNIENNSNQKRKEFCKIANEIEESIQQNNKTDFKPTKFGGKEIKINVKKGLDIDLYNASSSIKQLAPLLLYLRYRAKENDLLIIDEPEMNLHPESQAKLLEVLGMLVNAGVNVLLTTHSPYFMSHLNNLISGDVTNEKNLKEQAKSLYLKDTRAFLSLENVSAYEMKNNKLRDLKDKDYGIRWDTLSDVSADIQQKFFEIYEKGKETSNGKGK